MERKEEEQEDLDKMFILEEDVEENEGEKEQKKKQNFASAGI
jgi:hypothetical protein